MRRASSVHRLARAKLELGATHQRLGWDLGASYAAKRDKSPPTIFANDREELVPAVGSMGKTTVSLSRVSDHGRDADRCVWLAAMPGPEGDEAKLEVMANDDDGLGWGR